MTDTTLTPASLAVFIRHAKAARDWDGTPMLEISAAERGNLTDLKNRSLLTTYRSDGIDWIIFLDAGVALAAEHGITIIR